jgi:hypothetical protein
MSPFSVVPLVVSIGIVGLLGLLKRGGSRRANDLSRSGVYVVAKGVIIFMSSGTIGLILMPFLLGGHSPLTDWLVYLAIDAFMVVACLYAYRYRLELQDSSFLLRTFVVKNVGYSSIRELKWYYSGRGNRYLLVVLDAKKPIKISDAVQKLDDFADKLGRKVAEVTGRNVRG